LLVGDGAAHTIFEVTPQGAVSVFLGPHAGIRKPESLAFDPEGNLYIADNEQQIVYRRDRDGRLQTWITGRDGLTQPESICFQEGALYITDDEAGKLYRYVPETGLTTVMVLAGRLKNVQGIASGPGGSLLLTVQDLAHARSLILQLVPTRSLTQGREPTRTHSTVAHR
jgi:hypothetical protein